MNNIKQTYSDLDKLKSITKKITNLANSEEAEIRQEIERFRSEYMKNGKNRLNGEIREFVNSKRQKLTRDYDMAVSRRMLDYKHDIIKIREEKNEELTKKLSAMLNEFAETSEYVEFLKKLALNMLKVCESGTMYLCERDMKHAEMLSGYIKEQTGLEIFVLADDAVKLGGIRLYNQARGLLINETLDERLERTLLDYTSSNE